MRGANKTKAIKLSLLSLSNLVYFGFVWVK
ncbi:MAG: hypothetical protein FD167_253 [bacterium]|nr:MAG: hypothetical protein FD167_253 [bacterium]